MNQQQRNGLVQKVRALAAQHDVKAVKTDGRATQLTFEHGSYQCDVLIPTTFHTGIVVRWAGMEEKPVNEDLFGPIGVQRVGKMHELLTTLENQIQFLSNPTLH